MHGAGLRSTEIDGEGMSHDHGETFGDQPKVIAAAVMVEDAACIACGYPLRGIAGDGKCTECGLAVMKSGANRPMASVSTGSVQRMRIGAWLMAIGVLAQPMLDLLIQMIAVWGIPSETWYATVVWAMQFSVPVSGMLRLLAVIGGALMLSDILPASAFLPPARPRIGLQRAVRVLSWGSLVCTAITAARTLWATMMTWGEGIWTTAQLLNDPRDVFPIVDGVLSFAVGVFVAFRIRRLARMNGAQRLAALALVAIVLTFVSIVLPIAFEFRDPPRFGLDWTMVLFDGTLLTAVAMAIALALTARLMSRELGQR